MPRWLLPSFALAAVLTVTACGDSKNVAEFWRPISEPNIQMPLDKAQRKLDFDISQCNCGIYPANVSHTEMSEFQSDKQRLAETSATTSPDDSGNCVQRPSLVVAECMRARGWEVTNCSGRMPVGGGGSLCTAYVVQ